MTGTVLIAGSDVKDSMVFAEAAKNKEFNVVITEETKNKQGSAIWNRASPISARALLLRAENIIGELDNFIIVFDTTSYAELFSRFSIESISRGTDEMILGYQYLVAEILTYINNKGKGNLIFVLRQAKNVNPGILPLSAEAQFITFAENIALQFSEKQHGVLLTKLDKETDLEETSLWLFDYLADSSVQKMMINNKHPDKWIKSGTKVPAKIPFLSK